MSGSIKYLMLITAICVALTSCDRFISVDFSVTNQTSYQLQIIHCNFREACEEEKGKSTISPNTTLSFSNHSFIGSSTTHDFLDNLMEVPEIKISTIEGKEMKKDASNIDNWLKVYPEDKQGIGEILFEVKEDFFD